VLLSNAASLVPFSPEMVLSAGIIVVLGFGLLFPRLPRFVVLGLTLGSLALAVVATLATATVLPRGLFGGLLARDSFADFFKLLFAVAGAIVALALAGPRDVHEGPGSDRDAADIAALLLSVVLGACLMAAAGDLLTAYLALEFVSILSYVLTGISQRSFSQRSSSQPARPAEAAVKYAIYGGVATGAMLYGFSLLFGLSGSTDLAAVRAAAAAGSSITVTVAVTLCLAGLGFKMAVVPFHMWCPDVYEGAPTPIAAFFSIVPKAAGFALAYRFLIGGNVGPGVDAGHVGFVGISAESARLIADAGPAAPWALVLAVIAAATMTLGNLAALAQRNIKRLLAYSSIAHAGTLLMALAVGTEAACQALLIYLGVYLFMNLAAFLVVIAVAEQGIGETLDDFAGLGGRAPVASFCLAVALFSLTGLPPTGGFVAKYVLFAAVIRRGLDGGGAPFFLLALLGVANTVVSLYYYARVVRVMYLDRVATRLPRIRLTPLHVGLLAATTVPVVVLGIDIAPLSNLVARSVALWTGR
jgi:NADH-quinone oxidoreductase subunit N